MASDLLLAPSLYRCYYCQFESTENSFKYFDNKKVDQPRHQCQQCHKLFTLGSHGRPQGRTYSKKRNEDPPELESLPRQCRHCGVVDNAVFKYYNNNNRLQPRFKCLSCGKQFQMRLMGTGKEMRLVNTSCNSRNATSCCKKPRELEAFTRASNVNGEEGYQPFDGSFMPMPFDPLMPLEPNTRLLPESCAQEDVEYASFLETELTNENKSPNIDPISYEANADNGWLPQLGHEEAGLQSLCEFETFNEQAPNVDPTICTFNGDDGLPLGLSGAENAKLLASLEAGFLTDGNGAVWNVDTLPSPANVNDGLPWSDKDASLNTTFDLIETGVRTDDVEMVLGNMTNIDSNCTSSLSEETLAPIEFDSWSNDIVKDSSSMNYLEAAKACCYFMDMAKSMPVAPVQPCESSSSNAGSTIPFGNSSCVTSEHVSFQQDLMEEDQHSITDWDEWQEEDGDIQMDPWS